MFKPQNQAGGLPNEPMHSLSVVCLHSSGINPVLQGGHTMETRQGHTDFPRMLPRTARCLSQAFQMLLMLIAVTI